MDKSTPTNICAELLDLPRLLRPPTGALGLVDYEKAYPATTTRSSRAEQEDILDLRRIDRDRGVLVFVRPPVRGKTRVRATGSRLLGDFPEDRCLARLDPGVRREALIRGCPPSSWCGSHLDCSPPDTVTRRGSRGDCPARSSSTAHLAVLSVRRKAVEADERRDHRG